MPRFIKAIASFLTGGAIITHGHGMDRRLFL
jgi:hypothetical protein